MASSSRGDFHLLSGAFDLFEALCSQPDLLELVVQQCSGMKNNLRLACSRLRVAVDACVTGLAWEHLTLDPSTFTIRSDFDGANGAKHMAVLARCPRLPTLNFDRCPVADSSPLASCVSLRRVTIFCSGDNLAPFASLTHLEHLDCSHSAELADISALAACTALKCLNCSWTKIKQLPPLPRLEALICFKMPLSDISALTACTALKRLDCSSTRVHDLSP